ncbi:MAG: AAA family ATPase [Anaerolineae bacterium]|nr:AAA family ATPase [Anaerolineae bacterium]
MDDSQPPRLAARFFGFPEVTLGGAPLRLERHKTMALLAYLAMTAQRHGREALAALFWPDYEAPQANAYLRHSLWELRKALGEGFLEAEREALAVIPGEHLWVDVIRFQQLVAAAGTGQPAQLEEAAALYRGDFMAGFTLRDCPEFDDWQSLTAEALRRQLQQVLATLVRAYEERGERTPALETARRWLAVDPLDEAPHRALMRLYAHAGQRGAALDQYEACRALLRDELGAEPEPATMALCEAIRSGSIGRREKQVPSLQAAPRVVLPADATPFLGREEELAEIARLLTGPDCRLLTIVGPGGTGKTRLAIQAARMHVARFRDGAVFVSLAGEDAGDALPAVLAEALQLPLPPERLRASLRDERHRQLLDHLSRRQLLLLLDNAEHLKEPLAGLIQELLAAAPRLRLIVTSRERLGLPEEWVLEVRGLAYPGPGRIANLESYPAVQLFLQIARRNRVGLELTPADWMAVVRICQMLDGMPLGIELAAPWVRMLSCVEIAAEIERNLDFLTTSQRGTPERHRSLRAAFEHSWHLLGTREQEVFARLAVFRGGFTREAAEQVAGATLADLMALVDRSLVYRDPGGRFGLHEVLRAYAAEKLSVRPEAERELNSRHSVCYLELLARVGDGLKGSEQQDVVALLEREMPNLQLAWQHALKVGHWAGVRRALLNWTLLMEMGPRKRESAQAARAAIAAVRKALAREGSSPELEALLGFLLAAWRYHAMTLDPGEPPEPLIEESMALARRLPECREKGLIFLLNGIHSPVLAPAEAAALARESLAIFEALGDRWAVGMAQIVLGDALMLGADDPAAARPFYEAARAGFRALGNRWGEAMSLVGLALVARKEGQHLEALEFGRQSLAVYRDLGNPWRVLGTLDLLTQVATEIGDTATVGACLEESIEFLEQTGSRSEAARRLSRLAAMARTDGDIPATRGYLERARALCLETGDAPGADEAVRQLAALEARGTP